MSYSTAPLLALLRDPVELGRVTRVFKTVIAESFVVDGKDDPPRVEVKRRLDHVYDTFMQLRRDCGWSVARCLDNLPAALRTMLDGGTWVPASGNRWSTTERVEETSAESPELWTPERARLGIVE